MQADLRSQLDRTNVFNDVVASVSEPSVSPVTSKNAADGTHFAQDDPALPQRR